MSASPFIDVVPEVGQQPVDRGEPIRCLLLAEDAPLIDAAG